MSAPSIATAENVVVVFAVTDWVIENVPPVAMPDTKAPLQFEVL